MPRVTERTPRPRRTRAAAPVEPPPDSTPEMTVSDAVNHVAEMADVRVVTGWKQEDLDILAFILYAAVFILVTKTTRDMEHPELAPNYDELNGFTRPLARIIARRIKIAGAASGSVIDALACLAAVAGYSIRVWDIMDRERRAKIAERKMQEGQLPPDAFSHTSTAGGPTMVMPARQPVAASSNGSEAQRAAMPRWAREEAGLE